MNLGKTIISGRLVETSTVNEVYFDWYAGIANRTDLTGQALAERMASVLHAEIKFRPGFLGYAWCSDLMWGKKRAGQVMHDPVRPTRFSGSGSAGDLVSKMAREEWPAHEVTRADASVDIDAGEKTFEKLARRGIDVARRYKLKIDQRGDWSEGGKRGRTLYLGNRSSTFFVRIYEKGKKNRIDDSDIFKHLNEYEKLLKEAQWEEQEGYFGVDLVRCELEFKPDGNARREAAYIKPENMWGLSEWTHELFSKIVRVGTPLKPISEPRIPDDKRTMMYQMLRFKNARHRLLSTEEGTKYYLDMIRQHDGLYLKSDGAYSGRGKERPLDRKELKKLT